MAGIETSIMADLGVAIGIRMAETPSNAVARGRLRKASIACPLTHLGRILHEKSLRTQICADPVAPQHVVVGQSAV